MAIKAKCPNPACDQVLTTGEENAGHTVKCPACGARVMLPSLVAASTGAAPAESDQPTTAPGDGQPLWNPDGTMPRYAGAPSREIVEGLLRLSRAQGLERIAQVALAVGFGCLLVTTLATLLPWMSYKVLGLRQSIYGLGTGEGRLVFFLAAGAATFLGVAFCRQWHLDKALLTAAALSTFCFFVLLSVVANIARTSTKLAQNLGDNPFAQVVAKDFGVSTSFGVYLGLFGAVGAAASFAYILMLRPVRWARLEAYVQKYPLLQPHATLLATLTLVSLVGIIFVLAR
jgi:hypothetical protein